jgi:hypothetical protein
MPLHGIAFGLSYGPKASPSRPTRRTLRVSLILTGTAQFQLINATVKDFQAIGDPVIDEIAEIFWAAKKA